MQSSASLNHADCAPPAEGSTRAQRRAWRTADRWLSRVPVICVTFFAKLTVPPFGAVGLTLAIPLMFGAAMAGLWTNRLVVDPRRFLLFVLMETVLWGIQLLAGMPYSPLSLLLLSALHVPYVLHLRQDERDYRNTLAFFINVSTVIAFCGIAQYLLQFVVGPQLVFPIENYFPPAFVVSAFNQQGWIEYASETYRANGVFMLEPSFFSQLLAIAILVELTSRQRLWRLVVFAAAIVMSASGTGLIVLGLCLPLVAVARKQWNLIIFSLLCVVAVVFASLLVDMPLLNVFIARSNELNSPGSSGFLRYVAGFYMFDQFLWSDPMRTLFGFGAGQFVPYAARAVYGAAGTTLFKMVFEFGVIGAACYFALPFYCMATSSAPGVIRVAAAIALMLSGVHIPFAHGIALGLLLWNFPPKRDGVTA